jgi:asparagine synthase (glutamine-hydrolysing)
MCGIAGLLSKKPVGNALLNSMSSTLIHRGPDDSGHWSDPEAGIGLAHRRLSIVDLSPHGHQPMASASGRFMLSYNGEIYNHAELRSELNRHVGSIAWRGHSDTETLIEAIAAWGLEATLGKCVGMFALALWDRRERTLSLARDRFGEKPLYYGWVAGDFVFASELKALRAHPGFDNVVDRRSLHLFAARTHVPAPRSIYEHVYKLEPACILVADANALDDRPNEPPRAGTNRSGLSIDRYWSYRDVVAHGHGNPIDDEHEVLDTLETTLARAIGGQSLADVPVGAFLSGGIDSSTVVALYQKYSSTPVRTFSMGFEQAGYNEAEHAKAVAAHLGTIHHEQYVSVDDARDVIPLLPAMYDEPFADSSQIPTYLVSRFASEHVTVALSGDGGDELFAGYNRHVAAPRLWRQLERVPMPLRAVAAATMGRVPGSSWGQAARLLRRDVQPHFGTKLRKALALGGSARRFDDVYDGFIDEWALERSPVLGAGWGSGEDVATVPLEDVPDTVRTMYRDAMTYLPDDVLCKVDRAAMAVSLETRVPFLDHRVAELAARVPLHMKIGPLGGKQIVRKLLYREAPRALFERPKTGFAVPIGEWIKGPLRPWAEALLDKRRLSAEGGFDARIVHERWQDHLTGRRDSTPAIWAVLMFQAWLDSRSED